MFQARLTAFIVTLVALLAPPAFAQQAFSAAAPIDARKSKPIETLRGSEAMAALAARNSRRCGSDMVLSLQDGALTAKPAGDQRRADRRKNVRPTRPQS